MAVVKAADGRRWVTTIDDAPADLDTPATSGAASAELHDRTADTGRALPRVP